MSAIVTTVRQLEAAKELLAADGRRNRSGLQVSPQTVMRDWRLARAWLARELSQGSN
jgi:hypothetical protein